VQTGTQQAESLVEIFIIARASITTTQLDRFAQNAANQLGRGIDTHVLRGNVVLQTGAFVNGKFAAFVNWTTKATIVASGIITLSISLGVIDVFGGLVAAQSLGCDFELAGAIAISKLANISRG
jgi:hypothetical protein